MDVLNTMDALENVTKHDAANTNRKKEYNFDKLKMYFGEDCEINGVTISIPTIGDILNIGEDKFYGAFSPFLNNPTSKRVFLYDAFHKDWNKTKDIEVFFILLKLIEDKSPLKLMFRDISFDDFEFKTFDSDNGQKMAVVSESQKIMINEDQYEEIAEYIRTVLNVHPKTEKAKGKTTKLWMLQEDRQKAKKQKDEDPSTLLPLVSSCINHPGFKYKLEELKKVNICQFMDSVKRIQKYEQGTAAIKGVYSGMVSGKDIPNEVINFMGDI